MSRTELSSREIVKRCIEFRDPPRIAMDFVTIPVNGRRWQFSDFACVGYGVDPGFKPAMPGQTEWGFVLDSPDPTGENMGEPRHNPLAEGWGMLDTYRFPDFDNPIRYAGVADRIAAARAAGKYIYAPITGLVYLPQALRGMENWLTDVALEQENLGRLLDRLLEINLKLIDVFHSLGADGVITWDDMGINDRAFVSPAMFKELFVPRYRRQIDALHDRGMHLLHHCCGRVCEYMDIFVENHWDVLQLDQPCLMGIDYLGDNYGGKICFWNPVDIQKTMPTGDAGAIADEAHHQIWAMGRHNGGFMVKAYQQPNAIGLTTAALEAQYQAFMKYGNYPLEPYHAK
ncbi:MAG: hypothetical protein GXY38_08610 [Planctomycetes bacterium]|nr:hypothetical protein [Planctomycetota bacterium]